MHALRTSRGQTVVAPKCAGYRVGFKCSNSVRDYTSSPFRSTSGNSFGVYACPPSPTGAGPVQATSSESDIFAWPTKAPYWQNPSRVATERRISYAVSTKYMLSLFSEQCACDASFVVAWLLWRVVIFLRLSPSCMPPPPANHL